MMLSSTCVSFDAICFPWGRSLAQGYFDVAVHAIGEEAAGRDASRGSRGTGDGREGSVDNVQDLVGGPGEGQGVAVRGYDIADGDGAGRARGSVEARQLEFIFRHRVPRAKPTGDWRTGDTGMQCSPD